MNYAIRAGVITLALLTSAALTSAASPPEEVAATLTQIVINTRMAVAKRFNAADTAERQVFIKHTVLPAAIVGEGVHPTNDKGVVVLKMVVRAPRNPKNIPDAVEKTLVDKVLRTGEPQALKTPEFAYHARPIVALQGCLVCHGEPVGSPDPYFPQYKQEGWKVHEVIGAATARVKIR